MGWLWNGLLLKHEQIQGFLNFGKHSSPAAMSRILRKPQRFGAALNTQFGAQLWLIRPESTGRCLHDLSRIWRAHGPKKNPMSYLCLWWLWCKSKMLIVQNMRPPGKMFLSFQLKKLTPKHGFTVESSCDSRIKLFISQAKCHFCYKDAQLQQLHISILGYIFVITCFFHSARVEALWNQCLFKTCKYSCLSHSRHSACLCSVTWSIGLCSANFKSGRPALRQTFFAKFRQLSGHVHQSVLWVKIWIAEVH